MQPEFGTVAGPIALVTFLPDARADTFDLLQSSEPGRPPIAKEPQRGVVEFYQNASDVPLQLPARTATAIQSFPNNASPIKTYIVDVSDGGFARLEKPVMSSGGDNAQKNAVSVSIEASSGAFVQEFVPGQPFRRGETAGNSNGSVNSNSNNGQKVGGWPWWATALLIALAVLAIVASIVAIVLAVLATNKEKAESERLAKDEERLARTEATLYSS